MRRRQGLGSPRSNRAGILRQCLQGHREHHLQLQTEHEAVLLFEHDTTLSDRPGICWAQLVFFRRFSLQGKALHQLVASKHDKVHCNVDEPTHRESARLAYGMACGHKMVVQRADITENIAEAPHYGSNEERDTLAPVYAPAHDLLGGFRGTLHGIDRLAPRH